MSVSTVIRVCADRWNWLSAFSRDRTQGVALSEAQSRVLWENVTTLSFAVSLT